jgi:hypothetical protein
MNYKEICAYLTGIENVENGFITNDNMLNMLLQDNRKTVQKLGSKISRKLKLREKEIQRVRKM